MEVTSSQISHWFMCMWPILKVKAFENPETHEIWRWIRTCIDSCESRRLDTNDHTTYGYVHVGTKGPSTLGFSI